MVGNVPEQVSTLVAEATAGQSFRRWYTLIKAAVIAVPVIGATPTALNIYYAWKHGIPYSQVSHRLQQYELWVKNGTCAIDYSEINAGKHAIHSTCNWPRISGRGKPRVGREASWGRRPSGHWP